MTTLYIIYGLLLIGGGIMGYAKAKSQASLISGLATGVLVLAGSAFYHDHASFVLLAEAILAAIVAAIFVGRYLKTKKAMPAIPIIALSAVVIIASIARLTGRH